MGRGIGCKIYEDCGRDCTRCEAAEAEQIEKILKGYEKRVKSMTLTEINKDIEDFSAERKARIAAMRAAMQQKNRA